MNRFALFLLFVGCASAQARADTLVYITDLESHIGRWREFVSNAGVFGRDEKGLFVKPGYRVVFGGDATDRYLGDLEVLEGLVQLAERDASRFTLLLGNRDLNKLRFLVPASETPANRIRRVRRVLKKSNAANAFEYRRQEMKQRGLPSDSLSVADSFLDEVKPGGLRWRYLRAGKMAEMIEGNLIPHGAWKRGLKSPAWPEALDERSDFRRRIAEINAWKDRELDAFERNGVLPENLRKYQSQPDGIVYGSYSDKEWKPHLPDEAFLQALQSQGIHRILSGHRQYGDSPTVLRSGTFELILGDNSGCKVCGISVVEIEGENTRTWNRKLAVGGAIDVRWKRTDPATPIGRRTQTGEIIKGKTVDGNWLLYIPGKSDRVAAPGEIVIETVDGESRYSYLSSDASTSGGPKSLKDAATDFFHRCVQLLGGSAP